MVQNKHDIDKTYVSPADQFLEKFNQTHALSAAQEQERRKHARIALLRDRVLTEAELAECWEGF